MAAFHYRSGKAQLLCLSTGGLSRAYSLQQHHKLISAKPADKRVSTGEELLQHLGHSRKSLISRDMAEGVIYPLEIINICNKQRGKPFAPRKKGRGLIDKGLMVKQPCQRIILCAPRQPFKGFSFLINTLYTPNHAADSSRFIRELYKLDAYPDLLPLGHSVPEIHRAVSARLKALFIYSTHLFPVLGIHILLNNGRDT